MTFTPGDRITVTMPRSPSREGEYVEDRGTRCRVLLDGEHVTRIVLRERVKPMPMRVIDRVERVLDGAWCAMPGCERMRGYYLDMCYEHAGPDPYADDVPAPALRAVPKPPKRLRSDRYLAFVRKHPCLVCHEGVSAREAHHFGPHGMSVKCDDFRAISLCQRHHREFHDRGVIGDRNREETERLFTIAMRGLLMDWFAIERDADECDTVIVEALINHIRESQT